MKVWSIVLKKNQTIYACVGIGEDFPEALAYALRNLKDDSKVSYEVQCYSGIELDESDFAEHNNEKAFKGLKQFNNLVKKL